MADFETTEDSPDVSSISALQPFGPTRIEAQEPPSTRPHFGMGGMDEADPINEMNGHDAERCPSH